MQFLTIALAATGLIAPSLAAPLSERSVAPAGYEWNVSQWTAGCGDEDCTFSFLVKAPQNGNIPQFSARCKGTDNGDFIGCKILSSSQEVDVAAKLKPQADPSEPSGPAKMTIQFAFTLEQSGVQLVYKGSHNAVYNKGAFDDNTTFQVTPSHLSGN